MPWLSKWSHPLPEEDLLSYTFDHCNYDKDVPIFIDVEDTSRSLSYNQSLSTVRKLVAGFRAAGLKPGDCVSIASFNDIMYPMLFLGLVGAGGIFSGSNPAYTSFEIEHYVRTAEVKFVVAEPELLVLYLKDRKAWSIGAISSSSTFEVKRYLKASDRGSGYFNMARRTGSDSLGRRIEDAPAWQD